MVSGGDFCLFSSESSAARETMLRVLRNSPPAGLQTVPKNQAEGLGLIMVTVDQAGGCLSNSLRNIIQLNMVVYAYNFSIFIG